MKIVCLGDSLTEGDYGTDTAGVGDVRAENYPYFLSKITGAEVLNFGRCGFRSTDYLTFYEEGHVDVTGADIIIIMLGTNGGMSVKEDTEADRAYMKIIEHCEQDAPNAKIVLCAPPHATKIQDRVNYGYAPQVKEAQEFVKKTAKKYGYKLIDFSKNDVFNEENEYEMQPNDGLHFGAKGYDTMARYIAMNLQIAIS